MKNSSLGEHSFEQFSQEDIVNRAKLSDNNIQNNEVYTQSEVENLSKDW